VVLVQSLWYVFSFCCLYEMLSCTFLAFFGLVLLLCLGGFVYLDGSYAHEVLEYEINPDELDFTNSVELAKVTCSPCLLCQLELMSFCWPCDVIFFNVVKIIISFFYVDYYCQVLQLDLKYC
jgi:hypothetical protein